MAKARHNAASSLALHAALDGAPRPLAGWYRAGWHVSIALSLGWPAVLVLATWGRPWRRLDPLHGAFLGALAGPNAQHVVPEAALAMARIPMAGMLTSLSILPSHDSRAILPEITVPTLVLIGEDDDETPPSYSKAIVDLMPNATLVTIPGAGHLLNLEAPDAVNQAILRHWEST